MRQDNLIKFTRENISLWIALVSFLVAVGGFFLNLHLANKQIEDFKNSQNNREVEYVLNFDDRLNSGTNYRLGLAVDKNRPILQNNSGNFTTDDLDLFLGVYNQLSDVYDKGLISQGLLYSNFSYGLMRAYQNEEIQEYLKKIRTEDESYFQGFDILGEFMKDYEGE